MLATLCMHHGEPSSILAAAAAACVGALKCRVCFAAVNTSPWRRCRKAHNPLHDLRTCWVLTALGGCGFPACRALSPSSGHCRHVALLCTSYQEDSGKQWQGVGLP